MLLCVGLLGDVVRAEQVDEPTIFIYLSISELNSRDSIDDPELVPDWLAGYVFDLISVLEVEGETPQVIIDSDVFLGDELSSIVRQFADYPDLFTDPPYSVLSIPVQLWDGFDTINITPFAPFPFEPLPVGLFGWQSITTVENNQVPDYVIDLAAGIALYVTGNCEGVITHLQSVRENAVRGEYDLFIYSSPRFYEASCRYISGDVDTAVTLFEEILAFELSDFDYQSGTNNALLWFTDTTAINLTSIYIDRGLIDEALAQLALYADIDLGYYGVSDREFERFLARADLYLALNKPAEGLFEITRLIDYFSSNEVLDSPLIAWLYTERGYRYEQIGDIDSALADYDSAIEFAPDYPVAYYRRGVLVGGDDGQQNLIQFLELSETELSIHHPAIDDLIADAEVRLD